MLRPSLSTIFLQKIPEMMKNPTCVLKKTCSFCKLWNFEPFKKNIPGNSAGDPFRTVIQRDPFQWLLVTSNLGKLKVTYWLNCQGSPLPNSKYNAYPTIRKRRSSSPSHLPLRDFLWSFPENLPLGHPTEPGAGSAHALSTWERWISLKENHWKAGKTPDPFGRVNQSMQQWLERVFF